jgi:hypothetical protein
VPAPLARGGKQLYQHTVSKLPLANGEIFSGNGFMGCVTFGSLCTRLEFRSSKSLPWLTQDTTFSLKCQLIEPWKS